MALGPLMLDLAGASLLADEESLLCHPMVGGVILFARNYEEPAQLQQLMEAIRSVRPELLVAVDQEGGRVQRMRTGFTRLPAMARLGALFAEQPRRAQQLARDGGWLMASELLSFGIDFSFAPVLDLDYGDSQVIGDRSFGPRPDQVITLAQAWIAGMHEAGMAATGKHFPGHGYVSADSHLTLPEDPRSLAAIEQSCLRPFAELIHSGQLDAVMPAHVVYRAVDEKPAGFSRHWLQHLLRQRYGFDGVIFSDDLSMEGAGRAGSYAERAQQALAAGCDMVLACNNRAGALEILAWLEQSGVAPSGRLQHMQRRRDVTGIALSDNVRWQETRQQLKELMEKP